MTVTARRAAAIASLALALTAAPARAAVIVSGPGSIATTYTQPVAVARVGGDLTYVNADNFGRHDVVARFAKAPYQCPSQPGLCGADVPSWCLPLDPSKPWDTDPNGNRLPYSPGQCPIFWSELIGFGRSTPVLGTQYLEAGESYQFTCTIHPEMIGFLYAVP